MLVSILYFVASFIFFGLFIFFLISYQKSHNKYVFYYSLTFLCMFFFTFSSSVPAIVMPENLKVLAWSNIFSVFCIFCLIFACMRVQLIAANDFFKKNFIFFNIFLGVITALVMYLAIKYMKEPIVGDIAIIWNLNPLAGWIIGVVGLSYGIFWSYLFRKVALLIDEKELRTKMMSLSINGILYGLAAFSLFTNQNISGQFLAMALFGAGCLLSAIVFLIPYIVSSSKKDNQNVEDIKPA